MKKMMILAVIAAAATTMTSCEKYEDGIPQKDVREVFNRMYPNAFDVEWDWEGTYWSVSFDTGTPPNETEHEAWFDADGNWIRTWTERQ